MAKEEEIKTRSAIPASLGPQTVDYGMGKPDAISRAGATLPAPPATGGTVGSYPDMPGRVGMETLPGGGPMLAIKPPSTIPSPEDQTRLTHAGTPAVIPETAGPPSELAKIAGDVQGETKQTIREYLESRPGRVGATGPEQEPGLFTNIQSQVGDDGFLVGGAGTPIYEDVGQQAAGAAASIAGRPGEFGAPGISSIQPPGGGGYAAPITGHGFTADANQDYQGWIASVGGGDFAAGMEALRQPTHIRRGGSLSDYKVKEETRLSDSEIFASYMNARTQALRGDVDFATALNDNIQMARDKSEERAITKDAATETKRVTGEEEEGVTYDRISDLVADATDEELGLKAGASAVARSEAAAKRVAAQEESSRVARGRGRAVPPAPKKGKGKYQFDADPDREVKFTEDEEGNIQLAD